MCVSMCVALWAYLFYSILHSLRSQLDKEKMRTRTRISYSYDPLPVALLCNIIYILYILPQYDPSSDLHNYILHR